MAHRPYLTAPQPLSTMPPGIPYIIGNEAAERFSFYGMRAILTIYMAKHLVDWGGQPAHLSEEDAKSAMHLFVAGAYFFPTIGAIISDWLLGKYRTIIYLSLVYCLGHLALAVIPGREGLALGLILISIGAGGIKPCVSAHVGDQFGEQNQHLLSKVFSWFYFSINFGAFISTLLTPYLLLKFGHQVAFGVPGVLMGLATLVFWIGRHKFVHIPPGGAQFVRESFSGEGLQAVFKLIPLYLFVAIFWALFDQTASAWVLQAENMDREFLGIEWDSSQIQAVNPIFVLILIPTFSYVVYPALNRLFRVTPLVKMSIGFFIMVLGFGISGYTEQLIRGGSVVAVTSSESNDAYAPRRLVDGVQRLSGWLSGKSAELTHSREVLPETEALDYEPSVAIILRLREHKTWSIHRVRLRAVELWHREATDMVIGADQNYGVKDVEVQVGTGPKGPWKTIAHGERPRAELAWDLSFPTVEASHLRLIMHTSHGGNRVELEEIEVLTDSSLPSDSDEHRKACWPNVVVIGERPNIAWQLVAYFILTCAEILVSITGLEFSYTQAPNRMKSLIMSLWFLSVALGNILTSVVNQLIQKPDGTTWLPGASYYWFFTGLMLVAALGFLVVAATFREKTYIQETLPSAEA